MSNNARAISGLSTEKEFQPWVDSQTCIGWPLEASCKNLQETEGLKVCAHFDEFWTFTVHLLLEIKQTWHKCAEAATARGGRSSWSSPQQTSWSYSLTLASSRQWHSELYITKRSGIFKLRQLKSDHPRFDLPLELVGGNLQRPSTQLDLQLLRLLAMAVNNDGSFLSTGCHHVCEDCRLSKMSKSFIPSSSSTIPNCVSCIADHFTFFKKFHYPIPSHGCCCSRPT